MYIKTSEEPGSEGWKKNFIGAPYLRDETLLHGFIVDTFETSVK
jgi:hypothetical protein